jgi:acyl dehydratase
VNALATPEQTYRVTRADLVRYAGASGDFNPIHYSDRVATAVGLPGVIAHGMLTMGLAARAVSTWAGGPDRVVSFTVRFTSMVVVPDDDEGVDLVVDGEAGEPGDDGLVPLTVTARCGDQAVLGRAVAHVRPA